MTYKNLEELLKESSRTGIIPCDCTNTEEIVKIQDLIGHTSVGDLEELSHNYGETFYRVYDLAYGTREAIKYFFDNSKLCSELRENLANAEADRDKYQYLLEQEKKLSEKNCSDMLDVQAEVSKQRTENIELKMEIANLEAEMIQLKAKMYDLMNK